MSGKCIISGGKVKGSVLSHNVMVEKDAVVTDSVIFSDVVIEERAQIRNAIIDKEVVVPKGMHIGFSKKDDLEKGLSVIDGITVVPKKFPFLRTKVEELREKWQ